MGPPHTGGAVGIGYNVDWVAVKSRSLNRQSSATKTGSWHMECNLSGAGSRDIEDIVRLTSTHGSGTGIKLLERSYSLFLTRVAHIEGTGGSTYSTLVQC